MATLINGGRQIADNSVTAAKLIPAVRTQLANADTALANTATLATDVAGVSASVTAMSAELTTKSTALQAQLDTAAGKIADIYNTMSTDAERIAAVNALIANYTAADSSLQTVLETMVSAVESGAGLGTDGTLSLTDVPVALSTTATTLKQLAVDAYNASIGKINTDVLPRVTAVETAVAGKVTLSDMVVNQIMTNGATSGPDYTYNIGAGKKVATGLQVFLNGQGMNADDYTVVSTEVNLKITFLAPFNDLSSSTDKVSCSFIKGAI
jgi:hypothetical protein